MSTPPESTSLDPASADDAALLADLQALLLKQERARVRQLEDEVGRLQQEIDLLRGRMVESEALVVPTVTGSLSQITHDAIQESRREMAGALGPIIGEATRMQIRESRDEMVEALYPVIGDSVMRAVAERFRDFQRQIDARLRPRGSMLDNLTLRLRGIDPGEAALRSALPFDIQQVFLIQHESGLLIAHYATFDEAATDTDLISGMLTAIRSFVEDSFDPEHLSDEELDAIYHGDASIILQNGTAAYAAVVIQGMEPPGFQASLRGLVSELHLHYRHELATYDGDPDRLPDLVTPLREWVDSVNAIDAAVEKRKARRDMKRLQRIGTVLGVLGLLFCCFYAWFTWSLFPLALERMGLAAPAQVVVTRVIAATAVPATATASATVRPPEKAAATATPVPTATPNATMTPSPTMTPTSRPTRTPTATPDGQLRTIFPLWSRQQPDVDEPLYLSIPEGTPITIVTEAEPWIEIEWEDPQAGTVRGWVSYEWVIEPISATIPFATVTPAP